MTETRALSVEEEAEVRERSNDVPWTAALAPLRVSDEYEYVWTALHDRARLLATLDAERARLSGSAPLDAERHPNENHEFRTTCLRCGEPGWLHISLITSDEVVRIEDRAALQAEPKP